MNNHHKNDELNKYNTAIKIGNKAFNSAWMKVGKGIRLVSPFVGFL